LIFAPKWMPDLSRYLRNEEVDSLTPTTMPSLFTDSSVSGFNFIYLIGGDKLVPHTQIIEAIPKADFGLVSYQPNKSTENCIPTKMFEYMAHKLPMIVQYNPLWKSFCNKHNAAIFLDYKNLDSQSLYNKMLTQKFYPEGTPQEVFWDTEEEKLIDLVQEIIP